MRILVTGFEAFGKDNINPSSIILSSLSKNILGATIDTLVLPVEASSAEQLLKQQLQNPYDGVILLGVAKGRSQISIERVAINIDDYRIPDNLGVTKVDESIVENGPSAYFTTLPYREMQRVLIEHDIPCHISNTAGTYLCNHMFYICAHACANQKCKVGFVHVPACPAMVLQENIPSMSLDMIEKALKLMIQTLILSFYDQVCISACLCGDNCKYNGGNNVNESLMSLLKNHTLIKVCPEVMGGLDTPRIPSEQKEDKVYNKIGEDVTEYFQKGAMIALNKCQDSQIAILKSRSPSCGIDEIYDGSFTKTLIKGDGVFVKELKKQNIFIISSDEFVKKK